jgi:translation initiation factor 1A
MPNQKGGKNYKKSKHSSNTETPVLIDRADDQMYARIIRNLGNRNMLTFCNDNRIRLCHIRGSMRKRVWLAIGDLVLISIREFEKDTSESGKEYERGDIVAKYDETNLSRLRKMPDVNKKLFMQLETADGAVLAEIGSKDISKHMLLPGEEDTIEFDKGDAQEEDTSESSDEDAELDVDAI